MNEARGLKALVASSSTIHSIEEPPDPARYDSVVKYDMAWSAWWMRTHCWQSSVDPKDDPETALPGQWGKD